MAGSWDLTGRNVLLTGATGYVGAHLARRLVRANTVIALQRRPPAGEAAVPGVQYVQGDVRDIAHLTLPARPDLVIHQAALLDNPVTGPEPPNPELFEANVRGTHYLLEYAQDHGVPRFVYGSTAGFYGLGPDPFGEDAPFEPVNFYHLSKALCEQMCRWYARRMDMVTLRYSAPYGPGTSNPLLKHLVRQLREGGAVKCPSDGAPKVNPVFIDDAVRITERACLLGGYHAINVGGPEVISQRELIERIGRALGRSPRLEMGPPQGERHLVVDVRKVHDLLEYEYAVRLDEGIPRMVNG